MKSPIAHITDSIAIANFGTVDLVMVCWFVDRLMSRLVSSSVGRLAKQPVGRMLGSSVGQTGG